MSTRRTLVCPTLSDYGPVQSGGRLRKPYIGTAVIVALAAGIIGLGYLGPRAAPSSEVHGATASAAPSSIARSLPGPTTAVASEGPTPNGPDVLQTLTGLARLPLPPGRVTVSSLPLRVVDRSMALIGPRLFYIVASYRIESSVIGSSADPQTLAVAGAGESINELAAAGGSLVYVVTSTSGAAGQMGSFGGALQVTWSVWLLDLKSGDRRQLAGGTGNTSDFTGADLPIHVAVTGSAYAFDRPASSPGTTGGETVEVHSFDGGRLWSSAVPSAVLDLMLGGNRLAILTQDAGSRAGPRTLWLADATHPSPVEVSRPASSASFSSDGAYLAWDLAPVAEPSSQSLLSEVGVENTASGAVMFLRPPTTAAALPTGPSVSGTARGPVVAWLATAPGGLVYPAFSFTGGGAAGFFDSVQQPVWLQVEGTQLTWVTESRDGGFARAFAAELTTS